MDFLIDNKPNGKYTTKGMGRVHYAELSTFDVLATVPAVPADQAAKVTITDDHTFTGTEGFRIMYTTDDRRSLERNRIGEDRDSRGNEIIANLFFPGTLKEFEAFLLDDPELILLFEDFACDTGQKFQVGSRCSPARIKGDTWKSGTMKDGTKGYEFQITAYMPSLVWYEGVVTPPSA